MVTDAEWRWQMVSCNLISCQIKCIWPGWMRTANVHQCPPTVSSQYSASNSRCNTVTHLSQHWGGLCQHRSTSPILTSSHFYRKNWGWLRFSDVHWGLVMFIEKKWMHMNCMVINLICDQYKSWVIGMVTLVDNVWGRPMWEWLQTRWIESGWDGLDLNELFQISRRVLRQFRILSVLILATNGKRGGE